MNNRKMMILTMVALMSFAVLANAAPVQYDYAASISGGITISGHVMVETTNAGFVPGGMVEFNSGGITSFFFQAELRTAHGSSIP